MAGKDRPAGRWRWGTRVMVITRAVLPSWEWISNLRVQQWISCLPIGDPLLQEHDRLTHALAQFSWITPEGQEVAISCGVRILLARGYRSLTQITEQDLTTIPSWSHGTDTLDAALCSLGVFARTPQRGPARRLRRGRHAIADLVAMAKIPERFRAVTILYLETYAVRISDLYASQRCKVTSLGYFWRFISERYPEITSSSEVLPAHARAYVPYAIERARDGRREGDSEETSVRTMAHARLIHVRSFFADICTWASEPGSPFAVLAPRTIPLTRYDLVAVGFDRARKQVQKRMVATVLNLEREMPNIRAFAFRAWHEAADALKADEMDMRLRTSESDTFWDWSLLEMLVQSGLRIEEASELTTLDILKRRMPDGRVYYMLHVKPSKYDRARVIPIGDGLGRVIAEMIRHVKSFNRTDAVPFCDHWDYHEKRPLPRAPYLVRAPRHPSALGVQGIRRRLRLVSAAAGARKSDGTPLRLHPHDCRRVFATEHLNNNTPVHVIQALLGHASIDTVMVYAKLYPQTMVEEYRKAVRGLYIAFHGKESLRNPTTEEWAAFSASCSMRDMGTHLCALPTGEHCTKGLVCLGCVHAQPKKSAAPIFRRMLASHERELAAARGRKEPAGQIAARELEVARIRGALLRAEELAGDVAAAIEAACD
jgi:integrase